MCSLSARCFHSEFAAKLRLWARYLLAGGVSLAKPHRRLFGVIAVHLTESQISFGRLRARRLCRVQEVVLLAIEFKRPSVGLDMECY